MLPTDAVDLEAAERRRRDARRKLESELAARRSTSSPTRASWPRRPPAVVQAERDKAARLQEELDAL